MMKEEGPGFKATKKLFLQGKKKVWFKMQDFDSHDRRKIYSEWEKFWSEWRQGTQMDFST